VNIKEILNFQSHITHRDANKLLNIDHKKEFKDIPVEKVPDTATTTKKFLTISLPSEREKNSYK
jgi:hypothetical protein